MSMSVLPVSVLDVFAETPLAGNQLAVVVEAAELTDEQMLAIAREMNFSETTFVTQHRDGRATVRIFTPNRELPFAGHPTLGTAWQLTGGEGEITLDLEVGPVTVRFDQGIGWLQPPPVTFTDALPLAELAALVGLPEDALRTDLPLSFADIGPQFVLIPVRDLAALKALQVDVQVRHRLLAAGHAVQSIFVFADEAYSDDADFAVRMIFDAGGLREDPATGSANAAFAAYLYRERGALGDVVVEQGFEINRPSRLYLKVGAQQQVGGKVQPVLSGQITVP